MMNFWKQKKIVQNNTSAERTTAGKGALKETASGRRRYREDVPYALPKDLDEGDRLNFQHYALRYALQGNFVAPLDKRMRYMLDVGCGTGIWGQEMARQFPEASLVGVDLEPAQTMSLSAKVMSVPANYQFVQGNVLRGLPFEDGCFDYVHQRLLVFAIPSAQWPSVLSELVRVTHAGGWIELLELEGFYRMGPVMQEIVRWLQYGLALRGIDFSTMSRLDELLRNVPVIGDTRGRYGNKQVQKRRLDCPIGNWNPSNRTGTLAEKDILHLFQALQPTICQRIAITPDDFARRLQMLPEEWKQYQTFLRCVIVIGKVPLE